jgi:hypothetical protein
MTSTGDGREVQGTFIIDKSNGRIAFLGIDPMSEPLLAG